MARAYFDNLPCYHNRCDTFKKLEASGADDGQLTVSCAHLALIGLGLELDRRDECPIDRVVEVLQVEQSSSEVAN